MPGFEYLIPFALATLAFAYFPGPALLYTIAQTMSRGRRAGLMAALGIHIGCYVHVVAATLGLSAIFVHVPEAYMALKIVGAGYLVWVGVGMLKAANARPEILAKTDHRAFVESVVVELLNPKVALFFIAFLPQFVDPAAGWPVSLQFLALGVVVNLTFSSADLVAIFLTDRLVAALRSAPGKMRCLRWFGGSLLIVLGARLAFSRQ